MNRGFCLFTEGWSFLRTEVGTDVADIQGRKDSFCPVEIPHDWLIYDTTDLYRDGYGWYRKCFSMKREELAELKQMIVRFEGVYMNSTIYVNGVRIMDWKYGYSTFDAQIREALVEGENELLVLVRHQSPNSRWYSGAGIHRKVYVKYCTDSYLIQDGIYAHSEPVGEDFALSLSGEVFRYGTEKLYCNFVLCSPENTEEQLGRVEVSFDPDMEGTMGIAKLQAIVKSPALWDIDAPKCYRLFAELQKENGAELDRQEVTIGFKRVEFTTHRGFFLNGRRVKLNGVCEHHDLGCLGAAFHEKAMERKLTMLRAMGVNAIRTSHNMPPREWMELADRMGFLVLSEGFDMWERSKTEYDYGRFFKEWCETDVRSWVRRDRNHPSLLMWSIGNEIYDTHADEHGQEITLRLKEAVRRNDPLFNAPVTIGSNYMPWENARKCADLVKYAGYNYGEACYDEQHKQHPDWIMYGSETASVVQSRGIYHFPFSMPILSEDDWQCSALGNSATSWGAKSWEACIIDHRDRDYILGQFIWTGFDYIGEPTPYHTKNSYFGHIDTAGFPKDSYYVFQAEWTDPKKAPMVHLFPYWDFNPGQLIDLRAATNGDSVELFVNGVSRGIQQIDHQHGKQLVAYWQVPYEPGEITAVAYDSEGKEIARDSHHSFGDSRQILLTADKTTLLADAQDLSFLTVSCVDDKGYPVENAADYVQVSTEGPVRILGMDNGDSTDTDPYKTTGRKLFSGKLLIVAASTRKPGIARITVTGRGLQQAFLELNCVRPQNSSTDIEPAKAPVEEYLEDCCAYGDNHRTETRIPVRKLELRALDGQVFSPRQEVLTVEAVLYPADTTDRELEWKVVTEKGIPVSHAGIHTEICNGTSRARVSVAGDGKFFVRCSVKGPDRAYLLSQLEYRAEGFGQAFFNPYEFLSAGLYSAAYGKLGIGNEKGVATDRLHKSGPVFEKVDFGDFGSDELHLSVFALDSNAYPIEIWCGMPYAEGSTLLQTVVYQKPSIWNVYQEETFRLQKRLTGVQTIAFVLQDKVHIKGFCFKKESKAYTPLSGADVTDVYGDQFNRQRDCITDIGNNVTMVFEGMDFGPEGAVQVSVLGRTPLEKNTIHMIFTDEQGKVTRQMVEFTGPGEEASRQTFDITPLRGRGKVELVFLPGCSFDFYEMTFLQ